VRSFEAVGGTITAMERYDAEADCEIDGATFVAGSPGVYRLRVTGSLGVRQLLIRVVDLSVLSAIPDPGLRVGHGRLTAPRRALRNIVNHVPEWTGDAAWFYDGRVKFADHGIVVPHN
jgi:hypothetical protein